MRRAIPLALLAFLFLAFTALGIWQVQRLFWKLDLIARVDQRVHAAAVAPPPRPEWPAVDASKDEYRRVTITGTLLNDRETLAQAVTERGAGFWVMTPLRLVDGSVILINRGFVPADHRDPASRAGGQVFSETTVTGLLRMTEPKGGFLRSNDPAADRWFSRDIAAIAKKRGLHDVAPYFIDADASPDPNTLPFGGLTMIRFSNNHLVYAITWFILAGMVAVAGWMLLRRKQA